MLKNDVLAAMDLGTNSFHLVVAKILGKERFKILTRDKEVVRLGSSSKDMKYLTPDAIDRAISAIRRFKKVSDSFNARIRAVATSATREAVNKEELISRVRKETGIEIEVISGYEEARLIYLGTLQALPIFNKKILMIDIGGGSTEILIGEKGNIINGNSVKVGAVRLTSNFFPDGKIREKAIEEARIYIKGAINPIVRAIKNEKIDLVVGSSGTISNIGLMIYAGDKPSIDDEFNLNNYTYNKEALDKIIKKILKAETIEDRKKIPGLDEKRADIIVAGALILEQIFNEFELPSITISNFALREGIILDTINQELGNEHLGHLSDVRYNSILHLAELCNYEKEHAEQVTKIALRIFDFLKLKFELDDRAKEYLQAGSLLHDIGYHIGHTQHHKHSYYLIRNSEMLGYTDNEIEIISNIARYHRKSHPKSKHEGYNKLSAKDRELVKKLSGILRVADGLDRGHKSVVKNVDMSVNNDVLEMKLETTTPENPELELWGANRRKELFEESFEYKLDICVKK
jgi:exopolyphosphatase/guanosine-5'-triphosphate,3'-diphosphate pyrophosphatase